jgi:hypothetical protein
MGGSLYCPEAISDWPLPSLQNPSGQIAHVLAQLIHSHKQRRATLGGGGGYDPLFPKMCILNRASACLQVGVGAMLGLVVGYIVGVTFI